MKIKYLIFFTLLICLPQTLSSTSISYIMPYKDMHRFGDQLLTYIQVFYLAKFYSMVFFRQSIKYDNILRVNQYDNQLKFDEHEDNIRTIKSRAELEGNIDNDEIILCDYATMIMTERDYFNDLFNDIKKNKALRHNLLRRISPKIKIRKNKIPLKSIAIAVHVRKGGDFDPPLLSDLAPGTDVKPSDKYSDKGFPLKFPPISFYINHVNYLITLLGAKNYYVHIFTDDNNPEKIAQKFQDGVNYQNVTFGWNQTTNADQALLEDFFNMKNQFSCLIRPESNFSQVAQLLGNHKYIINPVEYHWEGNNLCITKSQVTSVKQKDISSEIITQEHLLTTIQDANLQNANWQEELKRSIKRKHFPSWMINQIKEDLSPFKKKLKDSLIIAQFPSEEYIDRNSDYIGGHYLVKITIKNNCVSTYQHVNGVRKYRLNYIIKALNDLSQIVSLPDTIFFLDLADGFTTQDEEPLIPCPVFSFSKNEDQENVILFPDPMNLSGRISENEDDPNFHHLMYPETQEAARKFPWSAKKDMLIWRGSDADSFNRKKESTRIKLIDLSRSSLADFLDVGFTRIYRDDEEFKKKYYKPPLSLKEHIEYKYQILLDGATTSWSRAYWQLLSNSVVFKQNSENIQWFYKALKPYIHYIPVENDLSNLEEQLHWALLNDKKAQQIAKRATQFAEQHLNYASNLLYIYLLITEYSKLLR